MSGKRKTNKELCEAFRALLTSGVYGDRLDGEVLLKETKGWRNDLWKAFRQIEDRMLPLEALAKEKQAERFMQDNA